jgi:phosphatidylglycerophosphate synthase
MPFESSAACAGLGLYVLIAALAVERLTPFHPHTAFGLANAITLFRAGGAVLIAALALEPAILAGQGAWLALGGAAALLALDGVDGRIARRSGLASDFGARFDLEVDAFLIAALAALGWGLGKAGAWILGLGLLRYAFVAAGWVVPALARPLPSARRRAVCVLQVLVLGLLLAPPLVPPASGALAAGAFAALALSFAIDVAWLLRRAP